MWIGSVKKGVVLDLAYSPDARTLFTLDSGGQVTRWDLATRKATALFQVDPDAFLEECPACLAVSPDGRFLLATDEEQIAVWDLSAGELREPIDCHDGSIGYPCFVNKGRELDTVGMAAGGLIRWSWPGLKQLSPPKALAKATEGARAIFGAWADPRGVRLAVSVGPVIVWDTTKSRLIMTVEVDPDTDGVVPLAFSPGGATLVVGDCRRLLVCDVDEKKIRHTIADAGTVGGVAFHPAGRLFASSGYGANVTFWDAESGQRQTTWEMPFRQVCSLGFSPDGCTCAAGSRSRKFAVWDLDQG